MKRLKDFFYDKNDILIALAILVIAALLIIWRMEVIMDYPKTLAEQTGTVSTTEEEAVDNGAETDKDADTAGSSDAGSGSTDSTADNSQTPDSTGGQADSVFTNGALTKSVTVTVQGGSATGAVQSLISAGLFTSYDEYEKICKAAGCKPEDIKATTFTFEAGSTQADIAKMVTQ